jgi:hypothetical protein
MMMMVMMMVVVVIVVMMAMIGTHVCVLFRKKRGSARPFHGFSWELKCKLTDGVSAGAAAAAS